MKGMNSFHVAFLPGDGIGPEVTAAARELLETTGSLHGFRLRSTEHPVGWDAVTRTGSPLPTNTLSACRQADAVFLGAVGDPAADAAPPEQRPETGLLALRSALGCQINLRPFRSLEPLMDASPLRPERIRGTDLLIVRELGGGLYYGEPRTLDPPGGSHRKGVNTLVYSEEEIRRVAHAAFKLASERRGHLVSVDKANVLETSRLWREVVTDVAWEYSRVRHEDMLVDRAAMELVLRPAAFDVILTSNLFGDILSDEVAGVAGTLGLLPSASLGIGTPLFEPVHGSAPDIAGQGIANPIGAILSAALLLRHGLDQSDAATNLEEAVEQVLARGFRTPDIATEKHTVLDTQAFTRQVVDQLIPTGELLPPDSTKPEKHA